jgi:predicted transcriptional regulator
LIERGTVRQGDITKAFGVPLITVKRYSKLLRERGTKGFFAAKRRRSAPVLTAEVLSQAQRLLDEGRSVPEAARQLKVLADTMHKAIGAGRLKKSQ